MREVLISGEGIGVEVEAVGVMVVVVRRLLVSVIICAGGGIVVVVSSVVIGVTVALNTGSGVLLVLNSSIGIVKLFEFMVSDTANLETDMPQYQHQHRYRYRKVQLTYLPQMRFQ